VPPTVHVSQREERARQEAEAKRKAEERARQEAEAKRKAEEERARQEAEAKRKAEEHAKAVPSQIVPPTKQSTVADVCRWLEAIGLSALVQVFSTNGIDGRALFELMEADLKEIGIVIGHRRSLIAAIKELQATSAPSSVTQPAAAAPRVSVALQSSTKFGTAGSEPVIFKGSLMLPPGFAPQGTCADALLANEAFLIKKVPQLRFIIDECKIACGSIMTSPAAQQLVCQHR